MPRQRIENVSKQELSDADRLELCRLLVKAGYCARLGKEKPENKRQYNKFVEYWNEE